MRFTFLLIIGAGFIVMGCSKPRYEEETWYDQSRSHDEWRQGYVDFQMEQGVPEEDAKRHFDAQYWIGLTENPNPKHPAVRHGDDLEEIFDPED